MNALKTAIRAYYGDDAEVTGPDRNGDFYVRTAKRYARVTDYDIRKIAETGVR